MHRTLLEYLVCPACKGDLNISYITEENKYFHGEIFDGRLGCSCERVYKIFQGVPILIPNLSSGNSTRSSREFAVLDKDTLENKEIWEFIWENIKNHRNNYFCSEKFFEEDVRIDSLSFENALILETGIGYGRYIPHILKRKPRRLLGVDITKQVFRIYKNFASTGKIDIIMADIKYLPFRRETFDIIISSRALHHCPDMKRRYIEHVNLLKTNGILSSVIYCKNTSILFLNFIIKVFSRFFTLRQLLYISLVPSLFLYLLIKLCYIPLNALSKGKLHLPLNKGMLYWSKFNFLWLWKAVVFDIVASIYVTKYTSKKELDNLLSSLPISRYEFKIQFGSMWNIKINK